MKSNKQRQQWEDVAAQSVVDPEVQKNNELPEKTVYSEADRKRFWSKVDKKGPGECWEWNAGCQSDGYGTFWDRKSMCLAHRISYKIEFGFIQSGMFVLHKCDNPPCVNPKHLYRGTHKENGRDKAIRGRAYRPIGEKNPRCKLKEFQVLEIRKRRKTEKISLVKLQRIYGISHSTMQSLIHGKTWKHLL